MELNWIDSTITLPPKTGKAFLGVMAGPQIDICWYNKDDKFYYDYYYKQKVIPLYWMSLPNLPI